MSTDRTVDEGLLAAIASYPKFDFCYENLSQIRSTVASFSAAYTPPLGDKIFRREWRIAGGSQFDPKVRVLAYEPEDRTTPLPAVLFLHGGGFFAGKPEDSDRWLRRLVRDVNCMVIAPDYRKAPEDRFPAAIEDCYATLRWINSFASNLGLISSRVAVLGVSAGGALAGSLSLLARDRKEFTIALQLLVYAMLDDRTGQPGSAQIPNVGKYLWSYASNAFAWNTLLGDGVGSDAVSSMAAPARATDLHDLPPTFMGVGSLDALAVENAMYACRLMGAGVPTELHVYPGATHAFDVIDHRTVGVGETFRVAQIDAMHKILWRSPRVQEQVS
jgi:acetyl esterase/lipase